MVMIMLMIKIMMINHDKKSEGTMMVISMILMMMMMTMMTMMMQLAICKTDKWEKQNPSGSPPLPNGHKCKSLAECGKDDDDDDEEEEEEDSPAAKWPQVQVPSYQTFSNCSQIAKSC